MEQTIQTGARRKYDLEEMLSRITEENRHEIVDWGAPVGKEIWIYDGAEPEHKNGNSSAKMGQ